MPALTNPRHERFAQELAKGKSASEAYVIAGFKANSGAPSRMQRDDRIVQRIAEIQAESAEQERAASQMAAERLSLSREWVLERLRDNAVSAAQSGDFAPSNRALELIGKEIAGMFVDRKDLNVNGNLASLSDDQLAALLVAAAGGGEDPASEARGASELH